MKIDCGPTFDEYIKQQAQWHPFFTIWPRRVGPHDCRCFEWIERRRTYQSGWDGGYWTREYRAARKRRGK